MANFNEITANKNRLAYDLLSSDELIATLVDGTRHESDVDFEPMYNIIFPYIFVDETRNEEEAYVCFECNVKNTVTQYAAVMQCIILVVVHRKLMKTDMGYIRADKAASIIDEIINRNMAYGIGEVRLVDCDAGTMGTNYCFRQLVYEVDVENNKTGTNIR